MQGQAKAKARPELGFTSRATQRKTRGTQPAGTADTTGSHADLSGFKSWENQFVIPPPPQALTKTQERSPKYT